MKNQNDPAEKEMLKHFGEEILPAIKDSYLVAIIGSENPDPKQCLEVGAAILLDKPLVLCLPRGRKVSENLRRAAARIVEFDPNTLDPATQERFMDAMESVMKEADEKKKEQ